MTMVSTVKKLAKKNKLISFCAKYISAFGLALTVMASLEPLLLLSKLAKTIVSEWSALLERIWSPLFNLLNLNIEAVLYEPLTIALFFLLSGLLNNTTLRKKWLGEAPDFEKPKLLFAIIVNSISLLSYSIGRMYSSMSSLKDNTSLASLYLMGVILFSFIPTLILSNQKILLKNLIRVVMVIIGLIILDRIYAPLQNFIEQ